MQIFLNYKTKRSSQNSSHAHSHEYNNSLSFNELPILLQNRRNEKENGNNFYGSLRRNS